MGQHAEGVGKEIVLSESNTEVEKEHHLETKKELETSKMIVNKVRGSSEDTS